MVLRISGAALAAPFAVLLAASFAFAGSPAQPPSFDEASGRSRELLRILVRGVDECFNPDNRSTNEKVKSELLALDARIARDQEDWADGNRSALRRDAEELGRELASFGAHASIFCGTRRRCLEIGFEANDDRARDGTFRYPRCRSVGGNLRANPQFRALTELLDRALPALHRLLRGD